jgi:hypothetical protein
VQCIQAVVLPDFTAVESPPAQFTPVEAQVRVSTVVPSKEAVLTPVIPPRVFLSRVKKRLFQPLHPSQAHTDGEDRLYRFMWRESRDHSPLVRIYAGSMTTIARAMGRDERNTRPLIDALIRKLAIQIAREQDFALKNPRVYYVFHEKEIAARRERARLLWAVKNKGIQLITDVEAARLAREQAGVDPPGDFYATDLTPVETILRSEP